jgi:hypothetical protein
MNTQFKFDPQETPNFRVECSDLRSHSKPMVWHALPSIWRHKRLVISLFAFVVVLAGAAIPLMPRFYSGEALIYPNLFLQGSKGAPLVSVHAAAFVTREALGSDAMLGAVVKRRGIDRDTASHCWPLVIGVSLVIWRDRGDAIRKYGSPSSALAIARNSDFYL